MLPWQSLSMRLSPRTHGCRLAFGLVTVVSGASDGDQRSEHDVMFDAHAQFGCLQCRDCFPPDATKIPGSGTISNTVEYCSIWFWSTGTRYGKRSEVNGEVLASPIV